MGISVGICPPDEPEGILDDTNDDLEVDPEEVLTDEGTTLTPSDSITITSPVTNDAFRVMDIRFTYAATDYTEITITLNGVTPADDLVLTVSPSHFYKML